MAKMKTGRTTSITTPPPSDYKKYQSDSTNYEEQSKFYKNYNFDVKSFGNQARFGNPKKANPSTVQMYNESFRSKGEPAAKDIYLSEYGSDEMFIEKNKNKESHGFPGIVYDKPVKPKQVIDPSKTKKSVTAKVVAVTPKETIAKTTVVTKPKEDMTLSKMPIKKAGLIKTEKREIQGELEKSPEYTSSTPIASRPTIKYNKGRDLGVTVGTSNAKMFGIGRNEVTPIGAKIVQKLTGYSKTDELDKDESGRVIFQGASGFKELKAQKKYNKEFDKYQGKQDQMNAYSSMFNNAANRNTIDSQISKLKKP
jgi:hypothetical protein